MELPISDSRDGTRVGAFPASIGCINRNALVTDREGRSEWAAWTCPRHGTDRALVDDPWQLPGEFVIGTDGIIAFAQRYGWCEEYPDPRVHIATIRMAAGDLSTASMTGSLGA